MSKLATPKEVFFFASILYRSDDLSYDEILLISKQILPFDLQFIHSHFPMKDYYAKEMGDAQLLKRVFLVCSDLSCRKQLVEFKIKATELENRYTKKEKRTLNFDIGFISLEQVVLATGKPYYHRIYLDHGVYANLELYQNDNEFKIFPWSYPDYAHSEIREFFNYCRNLLKNSLDLASS